MSHWNYRICKKTHNQGEEWEEVLYEIKEAYYNDAGEVWAVTENGATILGNDIDEIKSTIEKIRQALSRPVIDLDNFSFAKSETVDDGINWDEVDTENFMDKYDAELKKKYGDDYRKESGL
jgi:hypothetical protein